jgi:membrane-anchored glycerophosphoryl diester phosphodiesterase (GDPDase)
VLFGQVARAATIVSVAAAAGGKPKSLVEALDPAFTRMGAIVAQAVVLAAIGGMLIISVVGIVLFPYVAGRLAASTEVMMLENQRPVGAMVGSWRLLSRRVTRLLGTVLLAILICLGPLLLLSVINLAVTGSRDEQVISSSLITVVQALLVTPVVALLTAVVTLFYLKAKEIDSGRRPA